MRGTSRLRTIGRRWLTGPHPLTRRGSWAISDDTWHPEGRAPSEPVRDIDQSLARGLHLQGRREVPEPRAERQHEPGGIRSERTGSGAEGPAGPGQSDHHGSGYGRIRRSVEGQRDVGGAHQMARRIRASHQGGAGENGVPEHDSRGTGTAAGRASIRSETDEECPGLDGPGGCLTS